jgi:hypothetical protein
MVLSITMMLMSKPPTSWQKIAPKLSSMVPNLLFLNTKSHGFNSPKAKPAIKWSKA